MDAILPVDVLSEGISEPDREFRQGIRRLSIGLILALYVTFGHENFMKGPANLFTQALADLRLVGLLTLIAMTYGRLGDLLVLLRYLEQCCVGCSDRVSYRRQCR